jgi:hypothetical protein
MCVQVKFSHCSGGYYCQELQRGRKEGIMCKLGMIDCSVSSYCGGDRDSGREKERKERKIWRGKEEREEKRKRKSREKSVEKVGLNKLKLQSSGKRR